MTLCVLGLPAWLKPTEGMVRHLRPEPSSPESADPRLQMLLKHRRREQKGKPMPCKSPEQQALPSMILLHMEPGLLLQPPRAQTTRTASPATTATTMPLLTAGLKPACTSRAQNWQMQWKSSMPFIGRSWLREGFLTYLWQAAWEDSAKGPTGQTGTKCKQRRDNASLARGWNAGTTMSTRPRMRDDDDDMGDRDRHGRPHEIGVSWSPCRPRSLRAVFFQKPSSLHPFARPHPNKRCRRAARREPLLEHGPQAEDTIPAPYCG